MSEKKEQTLEEKMEQVKDFRPIDDTFFEVLADDIGVCEEMLQIILSDEKLIVKDVIVQSSKRNLYGRSVRLEMEKRQTLRCSARIMMIISRE